MNHLPLLIDLDGVLKIGDNPAPEAADFLSFISESRIPACVLSNSTLNTGELVKEFFLSKGIKISIPVITAFDVTLVYVRNHYNKVQVYCRDYLYHHFEDLIEDVNPDAVVIGDIGDGWNYKIINDIFRKVNSGADLIAMHKNKYWNPKGELLIDAGAFVSAIEYAASKKAVLMGKPSPHYFKAALERIASELNNSFFMIGDDLEHDIKGAQDIGGKGILIYTGKTKFPLQEGTVIKPFLETQSLREIISFLKKG